jgi:hypothetical protein
MRAAWASACGVDCALSLDIFLLNRFFSLSLFLLLDEPQPRKTNGEGHHHDQNGVLNHRSALNQCTPTKDGPKEKAASRITSFQRLDPPVGGVTWEYLCR